MGVMTHPSYRSAPGVGDVISQTFVLLRRRPGLFFGLGAVAGAASLLAGLAMVATLWWGWTPFVMAVARMAWDRIGQLAIGWLAIVAVVSLLVGVITVLVGGLLIRLTRDTLEGRRPTPAELLRPLGGFAARMLPLLAVGAVLYVALMALFVLPLAPGLSTLAEPYPDSEAIGLGIGIAVLMLLVATPVAVFLGVRLLYLVQVVAVEEIGGIAALRRSWRLTAGAFWRTFGTLLVAYLMVYAATMVVSLVSQVFTVGAMAGLENSSPLSPEFLAAFLGAMVVPLVTQALLQVAIFPFLQVVITVMYLNRTRELATPAPAPGQPPAPYGHPATPYPPNPAGYPPPQGYGPVPGHGWPQPGYAPLQAQPGYGPPAQPGYPPQGYGQPPGG